MDKCLGMIGLAKRAGRIAPGAPNTEKTIRAKKARLVIIASDASENTKKSITDSCAYYKARYIVYSTKDQISRAIGTSETAVLAVTDESFAKAVLNIIS